MTESEDQFLRDHPELGDVSKQAETERAFADMIHKLNREELGRAIVIKDKDKQVTEAKQTEHGVEFHTKNTPDNERLIGYMLPANTAQTEHLLLFTTGEMVVHRLSYEAYKEQYDMNHSMNTAPYISQGPTAETIHVFKNIPSSLFAKTVLSNTSPAAQEQFEEIFDRALGIATTLKTQREQTRQATMESFLQKAQDRLFPKPPEEHPQG